LPGYPQYHKRQPAVGTTVLTLARVSERGGVRTCDAATQGPLGSGPLMFSFGTHDIAQQILAAGRDPTDVSCSFFLQVRFMQVDSTSATAPFMQIQVYSSWCSRLRDEAFPRFNKHAAGNRVAIDKASFFFV